MEDKRQHFSNEAASRRERWGLLGNLPGWLRTLACAVALASAVFQTGCSVPTSSPARLQVLQEKTKILPYALVSVTPEAEAILDRNSTKIDRVFLDRSGPRDILFGVGDVVSVTVFEAKVGGLFIPAEAGVRPGNFITLPNQSVDTNGNITVPYAGAIRTKGRTAVQVQNSIVRALKDRAIDPQAVVALVEQRASSISVLGEVNSSSRFPANASGERLLDAITRAGGPKIRVTKPG